jgi:GNAT superfamily N-acetyltransferase
VFELGKDLFDGIEIGAVGGQEDKMGAFGPDGLLGRLAVDEKHQGKGLGSNLITDAVARCVAAAQIIGARGVITHALDDEAAAFYRRHGFLDAPVSGRVLVLPMEAAKQLVTR